MILLVSPCYHRLCETCIDRLFLHGSAPCPLCATVLRKGNFVVSTFNDLVVEKEIRIRKVVAKAFYKRAEDFNTERDYNDYLEEVEDIVFNLVNDVDVQSTYSRLEAFKSDNRDGLERNLARLANEQRQSIAETEAQERKREEGRKRAASELEQEQSAVMEARKKLIDDLASSSAPAAVIVAEAQKNFKNGLRKSSASGSTLSSTTAAADNLTKLPSMRGLRSRASNNLNNNNGTVVEEFDPLKNVFHLHTKLSIPELSAIPDSFVIESFHDFLPHAPSAIRTRSGTWNISTQMRATGFSVDIIKRHCLRAALS